MDHYLETALFEHRFWLQVLGDHARFIRDALAPTETEEIKASEMFISAFDQLLDQANDVLTRAQLRSLNEDADANAKSIREFKLSLIEKHLVGQITIELPPTFLNHMVNEVDEYIRILTYLVNEQTPPICHPLHHHLVWLLDAAGHAGAISDSLDATEKKLTKKSDAFTTTFEDFYIKAVEMAGYLRANIEQFPALSRFNNQVELEVALFKAFLAEIEELELSNEVLSTFSALMADHMAREECYYLFKLAESSDTSQPDCDPTKPRTQE
ncbi:DUF2935 domain-containing protein [Desertibacillus haloalkaliphilus]|uniref:DUF2935 domain-containing protein n=1 Tax=Desertibacillus haloalkaliphilus TaxID=1328930 RepID=UPI001C278CD9|nr:DUF2935 domain-containing protein [Desertibacillus haloalkaliphilus]MBU8907159.1 DUF2935 domain-containing protein [Desertibacillus haloalkaliphilus]